jgi:hypothetical protein
LPILSAKNIKLLNAFSKVSKSSVDDESDKRSFDFCQRQQNCNCFTAEYSNISGAYFLALELRYAAL